MEAVCRNRGDRYKKEQQDPDHGIPPDFEKILALEQVPFGFRRLSLGLFTDNGGFIAQVAFADSRSAPILV